ncbi:hypothetical protein PENTCL1PPCAC_17506 [Pristionchus entomophagus]|uniref:protein-ribulosamine 3-kinase n=1 Tax=Pristionchus entomophagus TaxID=358040 RepID=A0AAV5TLV6_9BILA|nr:hypothetical protein PENTCL1PPCAC_17506 [Pristionchus entomophagus]
MEDAMREVFNARSVVRRRNGLYVVDRKKIFIKTNSSEHARLLCEGEAKSLEEIHKTNTVKCPKVIKVFESSTGTWNIACEFIEMEDESAAHLENLGEEVARLHSANPSLIKREEEVKASGDFVGEQKREGERRFGFIVPTSCGVIPQNNEWCADWRTFFIRCRLKDRVDKIIQKYGTHELSSQWSQLERRADELLMETDSVLPSLVHGDLWAGNWGVSKETPVVFDACSSYSDPEFESGIQNMFGGFGTAYTRGYDNILPPRRGWNDRRFLYLLYHNLNHWLHFGDGGGYRATSLSLIHSILNPDMDSD